MICTLLSSKFRSLCVLNVIHTQVTRLDPFNNNIIIPIYYYQHQKFNDSVWPPIKPFTKIIVN